MTDLLKYHRWCVTDPVLMAAYREAILSAVRHGDVVLDLGAGLGLLGFQACAAGAAKIYAIEESDIIALAPKLAAENGFEDRFFPRQGASFDIELPERGDIAIASMLPTAGIGNNMLQVVLDARTRLLRPGGRILPETLRPVFCPAEIPDWYGATIDCWSQSHLGFTLRAVRDAAVNRPGVLRVRPKSLLASPQSLPDLRLSEINSADVSATLNFSVERPGTMHALAGWVEVTMTGEIRCSSSPLVANPMDWDQLVLPIVSPIRVEPGDTVSSTIRATDTGRDSILSWMIRVNDMAGAKKAESAHSAFFGLLLTKEKLAAQITNSARTNR